MGKDIAADGPDKGASCGLHQLHSLAFQPRGPSGHSWFRRTRFALALFSPFGMMSVVGTAKDIYLEKFGLDATMFSMLVTVASFWTPVQDMLLGRLQDKEVLHRFFPVQRWGRRAPWLLTHSFLATLGASLMYLPPEGAAAYVWFLAMWIITCWGIGGCIIAFEAARQQIYPFKEERITVEGLCKYACMAGGGAGGLVFLVLSSDASFTVRLAFVLYIVPVGLLSLQAVPLFKEARPRNDEHKVEAEPAASATIVWEALPRSMRSWLRCCRSLPNDLPTEPPTNSALQHLLAMKFWNGAYGVCISSMLLYYVTYVLRLSSWQRVQVIVGAGTAAGVTEAVMNLVYVHLFTRDDSLRDMAGKSDRRLLRIVVSFRLVNACLTFILIGVLEPSVFLLFVWSIITRMGLCSFSFWRISAQCWLVDEDCMSRCADGKSRQNKREGQIFGALSMSQILAAAIFSSLTFLGLGLAGLETENCEASCSLGGSDGVSTCIDDCFRLVINRQPESLRAYVRFVIGFFAPLCELLIAYHAYKFPIKNARLRKLYLTKAAERGDMSLTETNEASSVDAYSAKSQIVLLDKASADLADVSSDPVESFHAADFQDRVVHTVEMIGGASRARRASISVRFARSPGHSRCEAQGGSGEAPTAVVPDATPTSSRCVNV